MRNERHDRNGENITDRTLGLLEELILRFPENIFQISPETDLDIFATQGVLTGQNDTRLSIAKCFLIIIENFWICF